MSKTKITHQDNMNWRLTTLSRFIDVVDDNAFLVFTRSSSVFCFDQTKLCLSIFICLINAERASNCFTHGCKKNRFNFKLLKSHFCIWVKKNQETDLSHGGFKHSWTNVTSDLGVNVADNFWECQLRGKLGKLVGHSNSYATVFHLILPALIKFVYWAAMFLSILLYASQARFPDVKLLPMTELLNLNGLKWCFGEGYLLYTITSCFQPTTDRLPVNRVRYSFFVYISKKSCINFEDHFFYQLSARTLSTGSKPILNVYSITTTDLKNFLSQQYCNY